MFNYATLQIQSIAIIVILLLYLGYKIHRGFRYFKNRSLLSQNRSLKKIKKLSWDDFERLCMELFEKEGWQARGNDQKGADGGVDIWLSKHFFKQKKRAIVQCKRYNETRVTVKVIREMYGLMYDYEVAQAFVITTSYFTKECYKFAKGKAIVLIDADDLIKMMH